MAIINTYPKATPKGADLLIGTQVKDDNITENSTKSFPVSSIGSLLITSNDITTGSGTTNTIPIWTDGPNGVLGDSDIVKNINGAYTSYDIIPSLTSRSRLNVYDNDLNAYSSLSGHILSFSRPTISYINPVANLTQSLRIGAQSGDAAIWSGVDVCADNFFRVYDANAVQVLYVNTADQQVNIGSSYPPFDSKLNVEGDAEIIGSANGVILESPDGTRYRITVQNGGTLSVSAV
jgi:hypothetical protein